MMSLSSVLLYEKTMRQIEKKIPLLRKSLTQTNVFVHHQKVQQELKKYFRIHCITLKNEDLLLVRDWYTYSVENGSFKKTAKRELNQIAKIAIRKLNFLNEMNNDDNVTLENKKRYVTELFLFLTHYATFIFETPALRYTIVKKCEEMMTLYTLPLENVLQLFAFK